MAKTRFRSNVPAVAGKNNSSLAMLFFCSFMQFSWLTSA